MDKYEQISVVGEGSYGIVMKCRHKETGQLVAVKKFLETEDDPTVKKMALREIKMLKRLRHENLVSMLEVFRRKKRFYLVFEYMERTILEELEAAGGGLADEVVRRHTFQLLRALDYCHSNNIIHRDVKPENVLVSRLGVVKLCDFGFARIFAAPGEPYTEYVATRWYRAPELLIGDTRYGSEVDIWAVGCLFAEMMTGDPLFPGESDIDQLYLIIKVIGKLSTKQQQMLSRQPQFRSTGGRSDDGRGVASGGGAARALRKILPSKRAPALALLASTLRAEPSRRPPARELLRHVYFTHDNFAEQFPIELRRRANQEAQSNPLLRRWFPASSGRNRRDYIEINMQRPFHQDLPIHSTSHLPSMNFIHNHNVLHHVMAPPPSAIMKEREQEAITRSKPNATPEKQSKVNNISDPPPSPEDQFSVSSIQMKNSQKTPVYASPNIKYNILNRENIQNSLNIFPLSLPHSNKNASKKKQDKALSYFGEDLKNSHQFWGTVETPKHNIKNKYNSLMLPSVSGAAASPLKGSKIKLQPIENTLNPPSFQQPPESPNARQTPTSLPFM